MTDHLKFIVAELNKEPFNKKYNLISFDSLDPQALLQVLSDVICTVENTPSLDIRQEGSDETAIRLFQSLRIMKFVPPVHAEEVSDFRQGVVEGQSQEIYPILEWILERVPELQQRAYLSKYLVKVPIPPEFLSDPEVDQIYAECEDMMETFKNVHKEATAAKAEGMTVEDIRTDLQSMEQEKEQITRRIDKLKRKTENASQKDKLLALAADLRVESEKEQALALQKQEQRNGLLHAEQKIQRLAQLIRETKQQADSTRPEDVIKRMEDENKIHAYMVNEKLPKEISAKRKAVQELQKVVSQPAMDKSDLNEIQKQLDATTEEIANLVEKRNLQSDPTEDKLAIFRQQANIVLRKKETAAEKLQESRHDLQMLEHEVREKKSQMRDPEGNEIVTSVQFKNYVNKLRSKTNVYKKKRAELQDLRAEIGVLARTEEILRAQMEQIRKEMEDQGLEVTEETEEKPGTPQRPRTAKPQGSLGEIKKSVEELDHKVEDRKAEMNPLLNELKPLREQYQQMLDTYSTKKQQYDAQAAALESGYSRLEQEVKSLRSEVNEADSTFFKLDVQNKILEFHLERAESDNHAYSDAASGEDRRKSFRERLNHMIQECETEGNRLREEQKASRGDQQEAARQMKLWRDFVKIMDCKKQCFTKANPAALRQGSAAVDRWSNGSGDPAHRGGSARSQNPPQSRMGSGRPGTSSRGASAR